MISKHYLIKQDFNIPYFPTMNLNNADYIEVKENTLLELFLVESELWDSYFHIKVNGKMYETSLSLKFIEANDILFVDMTKEVERTAALKELLDII